VALVHREVFPAGMFTFNSDYGIITKNSPYWGDLTVEHYALAPDEVLLFQGNVTLPGEATDTRLILTNLHLVLIPADGVCVAKHPVADIKIYKDVPQIIPKNRRVEIFLTTGEITMEFKTRLDTSRFVDAAMELLTGKTKLARGAGKVKKALDDVNEAFGVNVLEEAKNFSVDTITHIVSNTKPSIFKLLSGKKKKQSKEPKK
jgi:hypothetical protein